MERRARRRVPRLRILTDLTGTAVTVQAMVFGNMGRRQDPAWASRCDPSTGENRLYLDFLLDAQGEDVVAGRKWSDDAVP